MAKSQLKWMRCTVRVLRMVSELHRMGYQRLRVMPYHGPTSYRVWVAPAAAFSVLNGIYCERMELDHACYNSPSEDKYFDWPDAYKDDARALAEKFIERFQRVCELGSGSDWGYAGWLSDLLAKLAAHPDKLPYIDLTDFTDFAQEEMKFLRLRRIEEAGAEITPGDVYFPLPPRPV